MTTRQLESDFMYYCEKGNLEELKNLLRNHPETDITVGVNYGLTYAAKKGHLNIVTYLLDNTIIGQDSRIYDEQGAYQVACYANQKEVVDYLFKHWKKNPYLKENAWEWGYSIAYIYEHQDLMDYFLNNIETIEFKNNDLIIDSFIELYKIENKELLMYLTFEYQLEYSSKIKEFLNDPNELGLGKRQNKIKKEEIKEWFVKQEFKNKLIDNYPDKNNFSKKIKI